MSLESEVAALTDATTDLLSAVNTSKATLDQAKDSAVERAAVALAQAGIATDKASEASASASTASTQAGIATAKADIATTKASEASGSAQTATTQASIATTKADEASASASTATTQAGTATTKAGEASTSAAAALASQNAAATSATNASASASTANTKAGEASGSAAQALAIYGDTAAVNTAVATAQAQASLAAGYAASAGSVAQQDLSAVSAALHRSPNAITAMFLYDTSKDSDGGAWTEKCQHTSWYNETIYGKWLGAQDSESNARFAGATLGSELGTNPGLFSSTTGFSATNGASVTVSGNYIRVTRNDTSAAIGASYGPITTVAGKTYKISVIAQSGMTTTWALKAGIAVGSGNLANNPVAVVSGGLVELSFTATGTTSYAFLNLSTGSVGQYFEISSISVKEVTATTTAANDYFQLTTDGKFYALSKNLLTSTATLATQTQWLTAGTYTLSSTTGSSGSVEISGAATASHTAGTPTTFTVATSGNVTFTVTGSVLTAQCELGSVATTYSANASTTRYNEVFRGNKRSFPKVAAIVAEAGNVNIYDLTEPGRPMWMRFVSLVNGYTAIGYTTRAVKCVSATNGLIFVGQNDGSAGTGSIIYLQRDYTNLISVSGRSAMNYPLTALRNTSVATPSALLSSTGLPSGAVNEVAMTVLPDAPHDPVTGLKVPTIGIATAGGISVIQNTGTVRNSSSTSAFTQITLTPQLLSAGRADALWYSAQNPNALGASFALTSDSASVAPDFNDGNTSVLKAKDRATLARSSGAVVQLLRNNESSVGRGIAAKLSNTFNAGTLLGDLRRCFLADTATGSVTGTVPDRSYKAAGANIEGTLTAAAVASNASLVAYSGFSAANYAREPFSADLDFGTGEWSVGAWLNTTQPAVGGNLLTYSEQFVNGYWVKAGLNAFGSGSIANTADTTDPFGGNTASFIQESTATGNHLILRPVDLISGAVYTVSFFCKAATRSWAYVRLATRAGQGAYFNLSNGTIGTVESGITANIENYTNGWYRCSVSIVIEPSTFYPQVNIATGDNQSNYTGDGTSGIYIWGAQLELGSVATDYKPTTSTAILPVGALAHRAFSSGPEIKLQMTHEGKLQAVAYDGTTTRTVTTAAAYNTGTWTKVRATYTTDGTLSIMVNGVNVATTTGTPLLTLNNANAVLTIGNSYALDAPFPGSIALLKLSATVPTAEQSQWMYEQEKQLFREGAQCVLPSSGNVLDLAYDDETDTWSALQATHESTWSGLVRTSTQTPSAGSFAKCVAGSGNKLLARTTTNPGVDIQMPNRNLKSELSKKSETAMRLSSNLVTFDYVGGFTATTSANSTSITSVSGLSYPTSYIGAVVTGSGIPASTTITNVSGTTIYLSKAATASASGVQISFTDFVLPVGYEAKTVMSAGVIKQEGSTKDWQRLYDGFKETIRFGTAPGYTTWVSIQAEKTQS